MKKTMILFSFAALLLSCYNDETIDYKSVDQGYSKTEFTFDRNGGKDTLTSQIGKWEITKELWIGEKGFLFPDRCEAVYMYDRYGDGEYHWREGVCSDELVTVEYRFINNKTRLVPVRVEGAWFTFVKIDDKTMSVEAKPNPADTAREVSLHLFGGLIGTRITISQSDE